MKATPRTLTAFASTHRTRGGPKCWTCGIPEAAEIASAVTTGGVTSAAILAWLREEKGYAPEAATRHRVEHHVREHVKAAKAVR